MRRRPARRSAAWLARSNSSHSAGTIDRRLRDPINLAPARRGDGHEGVGTNALRVLLCVRQRERGSPGNPGDDPGVDPKGPADGFDVVDELLSVLSIHLVAVRRPQGGFCRAPR